ncbi:MAG: GDSL-type esterase/lipase family protein, partial [Chitinispirillia bacterium]
MYKRHNQYPKSIKSIVLICIIISMLSVRLISSAIYLWDGIIWVYLGDSITQTHNYNQYMEAYFHLRYPGLRLHFREAGVSGATQEDALEIYENYVYPWEPDVVSVMFGHNGDYTPLQYKNGILELCDTITKVSGSLPVLFGPQPLYGYEDEPRLGYFCDSLASVSRDKGWPFADDWHDLKPIWDKNYKSSSPVDLHHFDAVHPGPPGHLCMTYSLLRNLDTIIIITGTDTVRERTTDIVSSAAIDASAGLLISSTKCMVSNITKTDKGIRFIRKDERLPMPFDESYGIKARVAIDLIPEILDSLNRYMLKISGLPAYSYDINIDGVKSATVTSKELAIGWNMASMTRGPI